MMNKLQGLPLKVQDQINKVSQIAGYLWQREWAERNAGNISVNLTDYYNGEKLWNKDRVITCQLSKEAAGLVISSQVQDVIYVIWLIVWMKLLELLLSTQMQLNIQFCGEEEKKGLGQHRN